MNELDNIIKVTGLSEDEILSQVNSEYSRGETLVKSIREEFKKELKLYNNQKKEVKKTNYNNDRVGDTTLFNVHCALMARSYVDRPQSKFISTKIGRDYVIKNLNATYEEDFNEQDIEILKYQRDWDKYMYGVGIVVKTGWNGFTKTPTFEIINPQKWIPDPDGDYVNDDYGFTGFERERYVSDLLEEYDEKIVDELVGSLSTENVKRDNQLDAGLNPQTNTINNNVVHNIYTHFTTLVGPKGTMKIRCETGNLNSILLTIEELKPLKNEKQSDIKFPFAFTYWKPRRNNPFGNRIGTYIGDVQRVKAEIATLRLKKSKAELYPMYMYNTRLIKNKEDLQFGFNKLVATNPLEGESLNNAVAPIQRDFRADNSYMIDDSLDQQVESSTSIGKITQGSTPQRREAATTNALQQDNTDINLALAAKIESWGEKRLIQLWLRGYKEKFADGDKKIVNFNTGFGIYPRELSKNDFLSEDNVRIQVVTVAELDKRRDKERIAYANTMPLLQTLQRPIAAQNYSYRRFLISSGIPEPQVDIEIPMTPQELIAQDNVGLLIQGEQPKVKPDYDPLTHLIAIKAAPQSLRVEAYRAALLGLHKAQGGNQEQLTEVSESVVNNTTAQGMSQVAQESANMLANT